MNILECHQISTMICFTRITYLTNSTWNRFPLIVLFIPERSISVDGIILPNILPMSVEAGTIHSFLWRVAPCLFLLKLVTSSLLWRVVTSLLLWRVAPCPLRHYVAWKKNHQSKRGSYVQLCAKNIKCLKGYNTVRLSIFCWIRRFKKVLRTMPTLFNKRNWWLSSMIDLL